MKLALEIKKVDEVFTRAGLTKNAQIAVFMNGLKLTTNNLAKPGET
jgi:hypothetical protein